MSDKNPRSTSAESSDFTDLGEVRVEADAMPGLVTFAVGGGGGPGGGGGGGAAFGGGGARVVFFS